MTFIKIKIQNRSDIPVVKKISVYGTIIKKTILY